MTKSHLLIYQQVRNMPNPFERISGTIAQIANSPMWREEDKNLMIQKEFYRAQKIRAKMKEVGI